MTPRMPMRFIRDRLLTLGAGISIALLVGVIASRATRTGYFGTIRFGGSESNVKRSLGFGIDFGAIVVAWTKEDRPSLGTFHYGFGVRTPQASDWELQVPFWVTAPLLCVMPIRFGWVYYRQRRRTPPGKCPNCGYDLRASPERCPECGAEPGEE